MSFNPSALGELRPETQALHAGQAPDPTTHARAVPIYATTSLRLRRRRPRGAPVRAPGVREHLHPDHEPDDRRVRGARRGPRGRRRGPRPRVRPGGRDPRDPQPRPRRPEHRLQLEPLRRHVQPVPLHAAQARHRGEVRRRLRPGELRGRDRRQHPRAVPRDHRQPAARRRRHRGHRRRRPPARRAAHRRQHLRPAARPPDRARRGHRRPLGDEVDRRPRDGDRRRRRGRRQVRLVRLAAVQGGLRRSRSVLPRRVVLERVRPARVHPQAPGPGPARHRPRAQPVQRLPAAPGPRDAPAAHRAPQRERPQGRPVAAGPPGDRLGQLPGPQVAPVLRDRRSRSSRAASAASSRSASRAARTPAGS